ncbi:MAG: prohibitin family protein [Cyanobacteria bacterium Co-bin13]|nr:prohibitin family protein [Cyanobacteria bacterium Co-bin13]
MIVPAGERGVWMRFGKVQETVFEEGLHFVIPLVDTVETLSTRVQKQEISVEASSKDLQDVFTDIALNWHILPNRVNTIFEQIGDDEAVVESIIDPAVEEIIKAVMARYTAEEIITLHEQAKTEVDHELQARLSPYSLAVDDVSLVHVHFSERFRDAVEAKQIAEQEAKRAEFIARKAARQAETKVNLARGEAEAHRILKDTLTPEILKNKAIERWDGKLPLISGSDHSSVVELDDLIELKK